MSATTSEADPFLTVALEGGTLPPQPAPIFFQPTLAKTAFPVAGPVIDAVGAVILSVLSRTHSFLRVLNNDPQTDRL